MELNIEHPLTVAVMFMDVIIMMCHVQFVMPVIVLQSTWFLLSTHAPVSGWKREYYGYLMGQYYNYNSHQFTCVDIAFKPVVESSADRNGL